MFEERYLPTSAERAILWHDRFTCFISFLLVFGPFVVLGVVFNLQAAERLDDRWALLYLFYIPGLGIWAGYREWRFRRWWPCPQCLGRLKAEAHRSARRTWLLICSRCMIRWESDREFEEARGDAGG